MLYLTFDIGTTSLKTALINGPGELLAVHVEEYALETPRPDWAELDPETYWFAAKAGIEAVFEQCGKSRQDLSALGFSSQGQSFIPLDEAGNPLYNAIVWVDGRAQKIAEEWEREWLSLQEYQALSGYPSVAAGLTVFKLAWLARYEPTAHQAARFLFLPDYLIWRLTGAMATDYNLAQMSGLYDIRTGDWHPQLMEAAGITPEQLPQVLSPGTVAGELLPAVAQEWGLPAGVPVCVGCNDQLAGAVGAGNVQPGVVTETTGTALALIVSTPELLVDRTFYSGVHAVPGLFYAMPHAGTSAIVLKWLRDLAAPGASYEEFLEGVDSVPVGCEGLTVLPHYIGSGAPEYNPRARGVFAGLTLRHERQHLVRAIMEACACLLQECLEPVQAHQLQVDAVRSLGGAARSDLWLQMKADLLGIAVERPVCSDAANLGGAMLAAVGTGQFRSLQEAAAAWYRPARTFKPDATRHTEYRQVYAKYRDLYERLYARAKRQSGIQK